MPRAGFMAIGMDWTKRRGIVTRSACAMVAVLGLALAAPAAAQGSGAAAQPSAPPALENLNTALDALADTPNDVSALLRAGWASLKLGDTQASLGFFRRADRAAPANGEAKAGEASAMLRLHDPVSAVKLFAAAEGSGAPMARYAGDRGLALDLVGQNVAAQRNYRLALAQNNDPEIVRRLALSQAISGDERAAEATLLPLLKQQDLSAYRTRAFALAILGKGEEAVSIAEKLLPADLSSRMAPYLRYMPRLTRAQQAAAANLGEFPPASEIGRDDPQIAVLSAQNPTPPIAERGPDSRLVPAGKPLGRSERSSGDRRKQRREKADKRKDDGDDKGHVSVTYAPLPQAKAAAAPAVPPPPPPPTVHAAVQQSSAPVPDRNASAPEETAARPVVVASLDQQPASTLPAAGVDQPPRPSLSISQPPIVRAATKSVSLADAFADFATDELPAVRKTPGAVDITKIKPIRETPKPEPRKVAKPKPPANPSRFWVQIGTGRNLKALAFTWRRLSKRAGALLAKHAGYTAKWGETRRLLTGPYKSEDEAQDAVAALKKKGFDSFEFTSDEGEEVVPLK